MMAKEREHVIAARLDEIHKLTSNLVKENDMIVISPIADVPFAYWGEFQRQLKYKCRKYGKVFIDQNVSGDEVLS